MLEVDLLYGKLLRALFLAETEIHALGCTEVVVSASLLGACSGPGVHSLEHPNPRQKWKEIRHGNTVCWMASSGRTPSRTRTVCDNSMLTRLCLFRSRGAHP